MAQLFALSMMSPASYPPFLVWIVIVWLLVFYFSFSLSLFLDLRIVRPVLSLRLASCVSVSSFLLFRAFLRFLCSGHFLGFFAAVLFWFIIRIGIFLF